MNAGRTIIKVMIIPAAVWTKFHVTMMVIEQYRIILVQWNQLSILLDAGRVSSREVNQTTMRFTKLVRLDSQAPIDPEVDQSQLENKAKGTQKTRQRRRVCRYAMRQYRKNNEQ
jgi:hypothetical protein